MPYIHRLLSKTYQKKKSQEPSSTSSSSLTIKENKSILEQIAMEVDWGTVLIYTCSADCDSKDPKATIHQAMEYVAIQIESE
jgi:hypothetical protein